MKEQDPRYIYSNLSVGTVVLMKRWGEGDKLYKATVTRIKKCDGAGRICKDVNCPGDIGFDNNDPDCYMHGNRQSMIHSIVCEFKLEEELFEL